MAENETNGAEQQPNGAGSFAIGANGADTGPQLGILGQYVKDLSFENPNAPAVYQQQNAPEIDVQFEIGVNQVAEDVHEVAMTIRAKAKSGDMVAFNVELTYAGLFAARNLPPEHLHPYLYAEAPRLLFPFARAIVADQVRDGAFPPLMLDPIDFGALYQQQSDAALAQAEPAGQA